MFVYNNRKETKGKLTTFIAVQCGGRKNALQCFDLIYAVICTESFHEVSNDKASQKYENAQAQRGLMTSF